MQERSLQCTLSQVYETIFELWIYVPLECGWLNFRATLFFFGRPQVSRMYTAFFRIFTTNSNEP